MELTVQIGFDELVQAIKKLPPEQQKNLQEVLQNGISPIRSSQERRFGSLRGLITYMADDFDAPLDDFKEYM